MTKPEVIAERIARAERAFHRHVIDRVPLSELAPETGYSYDTVKADVQVWRDDLTKEQTPNWQKSALCSWRG